MAPLASELTAASFGRISTRLRIWLVPLVILAAVTMAIYIPAFVVDYRVAKPKESWFQVLFTYDLGTAQNALANLAQVVASVLAIAITVVSIIVQLAATRYTPRITEMFFRDRTNFVVLGFFVVSCTFSVWVSLSVGDNFIPHLGIAITLILMTASLLLLLPYFAYVFDFLQPAHVVARIQEQAVQLAFDAGGPSAPEAEMSSGQASVVDQVEQIADISLNALQQKDKAIAMSTVHALKDLLVKYLEKKATLQSGWFAVGPRLRNNPDFISLSQNSVEQLERQRVWLEMKVLRQYEQIFGEALNRSRDITHLIAINTRTVAEFALITGDSYALDLCVKYFNTYLRAVINTSDVRTGYNLFNQYRLLAEQGLRAGNNQMVEEVCFYFKYYAQLSFAKGLPFITETAAFDLCALNELAFDLKVANRDALLQILLEVDKRSETEAQEKSLRGVRMAQTKLATYYLTHNRTELARRICDDMKDEPATLLRSIRDELISTDSEAFWEVVDRGSNFTYLEPKRRRRLEEFFSWFPQLVEEPPAPGASAGTT